MFTRTGVIHIEVMRGWSPRANNVHFRDISDTDFVLPISTIARLYEGMKFDYIRNLKKNKPELTEEQLELQWCDYIDQQVQQDQIVFQNEH